jgi:ubiquinol-cytochrome c reductase cytochrome c subunit
VKSLEENPGYGGFSMGALGPVSEGMFAWVVGIGGLVGFTVWIAAHTSKSEKRKKA